LLGPVDGARLAESQPDRAAGQQVGQWQVPQPLAGGQLMESRPFHEPGRFGDQFDTDLIGINLSGQPFCRRRTS
jgi:hypothetical protein